MINKKVFPYTHQELMNFTHNELSDVTHSILQGELKLKIDWSKGDFYNFDDLNNVEMNTRLISDLVKYFKEIELSISTVEDRDIKSIEFADSLNRIESNIKLLCDAIKPIATIEPKTYWQSNMPFSYEDANRLEMNLKTVYEHLTKNIENLNYCGAYVCGEVV